MDANQWKRVEEALQAALELEPPQRESFLAGLETSDASLAREVRSLLAEENRTGSFLETPAIHDIAKALRLQREHADTSQSLVGMTISRYQVVEKLGQGGMGVVYKARDVRLNRFVALKFLGVDLARDADALRRFEREARACSALNHPNLCTIYDAGEHDGHPFLVMEFLDGVSLKEVIAGTPLESGLLKRIALQIAEGLAAAHRGGILHRDIKPANLFITEGGLVKILDFGLAKMNPMLSGDDPTLTADSHQTVPGSVLGTLRYMSPEQVRAENLDARSDLFSCGVVLYEMSTGKQPFIGESFGLVADSILNRDPVPASEANPGLAPEVALVVERCLCKNREQRYQSAEELRADLEKIPELTMPASARSTAVRRTATPTPWKRLFAIGTALAVIAAIVIFWPSVGRLSAQDTLVLADFRNSTGDSVFDDTLRQGLSIQLEQSPYLRLIPDQRIRQVLRLMNKSAEARVTLELAREVCERTASAAVISGSIDRLGSAFIVGLQAQGCKTGEALDRQQVQVSRKEDVLDSLNGIARTFRKRMGEKVFTIEKYSTPLAEATTPSLEALKAYSSALRQWPFRTGAESLTGFRRAVEIDPQFAMAHGWIGRVYGNMGETGLSEESIKRAFALRNRASAQERFWITTSYHLYSTGNLEEALRVCQEWAQTYPRDTAPHGFLAGLIYQQLGQYQESLDDIQVALRIDREFAPGYVNQVWDYVLLSKLPEAERALKVADEHKIEAMDLLSLRYRIAFLKGDGAEMQRVVALAQEKPAAADWLLAQEASALGYAGQLRAARERWRTAVAMAHRSDAKERAAIYEAAAAVQEAHLGNFAEARPRADAALRLSKAREVEYGAALALAMSGNAAVARNLLEDLSRRFPQDTLVRFTYVPVLSAVLALNEGKPEKAIESLAVAALYDLAEAGTWFGHFGDLYPVFVRAQALLAAHRAAEAVGQFQKIIANPGLVGSDVMGPLARLGMARGWTQMRDGARATKAYEDLSRLWRDADPDIPAVKQVRAEHTRHVSTSPIF